MIKWLKQARAVLMTTIRNSLAQLLAYSASVLKNALKLSGEKR
jgi:hypothetical protein